MLEATREMWQQDLKILEFMRLAGWFVLPYSIYVAYKSPSGPIGGVPFLLLGLLLINSVKIQVFKARREIRKFKWLGTEAAWSFTQAGTELVSSGETTREKWEGYHRVVRNPRGFLLYPQKGRICWLPAKAFASEQDVETLEKYIKERVKNYRKVK